ncbi:DUF11 domain-containing protein [Nitrosomonas sp. Is24]|uniref:beta strand repeat-containing protein n=1 Tax=Nitrosomonas sp. Is24 TaxID=3080533 RepID=UPI00294B282D|nr:DUF11 domain-containing protein [Nitrosomonas sp. Is24]MDV6342373.1 DUF11 domain-containing protein [Nitrosomonas sp. Is24]
MATVFTDKPDYNPGQTALITTDGFLLGSNIKFQVQHILAGLDGVFGVNPLTGINDDLLGNNTGSGHLPWVVTDGDEANDLDKSINGSIQTLWYVNPDDSLNETFLLTATGAGADGEFGTSDDEVATSIFTDSAGTYTLKWTAADPAVNKAPYLPTYTKISPAEYLTAGFTYPSGRADLPSSNPIDNAVAYGPTFIASDLDAVTSLTPKDMALGQIVPFEMIISVNGDTTPENGVITFTTDLLAKTTSGDNFGFDTNYKIIAAFVDTGDVATVDPGLNATVDIFSSVILGAGTKDERIQSTVQLSGLNNGDNIVVELWAVLKDTISLGVSGNVQTSLVSAHTGPATTPIDKNNSINTGKETVPLLQVGDFFTSQADLSIIKSDSADASTNSANLTANPDVDPADLNPGDTFTYTILAKNNSTDTVANGVVVTDTLDANVTFVSVTGGGVFADNGAAADTVTWNVGSLSPGETQVLTVTVRVNDNAPTGNLTQDLLNSVSITAITKDPTPGNNINTEPTNLEVGFTPSGAIAIIKTTNGTDGPTISEGETVTWTYTVSNTGNVDLSNIQVVDDNGTASNSDDFKPTLISGDDGDDGILGLNEVWTFQATGVAYPVNYSNIGTASGEYLDSANLLKTVDSSDPSSYVGENVAAKITIDKSGPATISEGGANVIYNFTITADATNASTDPVTITSLSDNTFSAADNTALFAAALAKYQETNPSATAIVLNPGESLSFSFDPTGNLVLDAGEEHTNTVTVEGKDDDAGTPTISDTDDHTVTGENVAAKITIDKSGPATISEGGANVIYNFTITADATNASTDPVTITSLSDNTFSAADNTALFAAALAKYQETNPSATAIVLNPGESLSFSFDPTGNLVLDAGEEHTNTVTVEGKDDDAGTPTISDTDDHTVTGENVAAKITIDKSGPATISEGGANVIYNFTITADATNASTDPVTITSLSDNTFSAADNTALFAAALAKYQETNPSATAIVLNPGESLSFSFDPTGNLVLDAGEEHTNTVTVEGKDDDAGTPTISDTDDHTVTGENVAAKITIDKSGPATISEGGANVIYNFTITADATNASTDPVTITSLSDNTFSAADNTALFAAALAKYQETNPSATAIVLNPGESLSFSFDPTGNLVLDAGEEHTNTVTVEGKDDDAGTPTISDTDDHTVTGENVAAKITIDKSGPATISEGGANVIYNFTITADATNASTDPVTITSLSDNTFSAADNTALFAAALAKYQETNPSATAIVLNPGESLSFSFDPTGNLVLDAGEEHTNTVTVEGKDDDAGTPTISDTDDHTVTGENVAAKITIDKSGPATISEGGANVIYNFTITADATNASTDPVTITSLSDNTFSAADNTALFAAALAKYQETNPSATAIVLNPGESLSFSFDPTGNLVLDAGEEHTNTVTVEGKDDDAGTPTISDTDDHTVTGENVAAKITIDKSGPATISEGGANVIYNFTITADATNASTDPVTITSLSDNTFSAADNTALFAAALAKYQETNPSATAIVLNPGESLSFSFDPTGNLVLDAGEEHTNTVTVEGKDDDAGTPTISDTDDHTVTGENVAAKITIDKSGPATISEGGANVIYNFTITADATNASTDPVTITSLSDNTFSAADNTALFAAALAKYQETNPSATAIVLNPGESLSFSFDPTGNLVLDAGEEHTNTVTVEGKDDDAGTPTISDTDDHTVTALDILPEISVIKTVDVNGDGNASTGTGFNDSESVSEGIDNKAVTYRYAVTSHNAEALSLDSLSDDKLGDILDLGTLLVGSDTNSNGMLDQDETWVYTLATTIAAGNVDSPLINEVTAEASDDDDNSDTETDTAKVTFTNATPTITVDKLVDANGDNIFHDMEAANGNTNITLTYQYTITAPSTNVSTDPITVSSVIDDKLGDLTSAALVANGGNPIVLNPDESFTFTYTKTGVDLSNVGTLVNKVTVNGHDDENTAVSDTDTATVIKSGYVTNSALSEFDTNSAVAGQQFNLIATPTPWISSGTYKVTDSNPGQFYYNAFATGNAGDIAHIKLNIPYPFVTQGATPIHVYSGVDIHTDSNGMISFDPVGEIAISKEQIAISSFTDTNGDGKIGFGDIYTASLDVTVPASGFIYANIHLDYGLEKTGPWTKFVDSTGGNDMKPGSGNPYQTIEDFGSYGFSSLINSVLGQDTIQNQNIFKNLKGVGGFIHTADDHNPIGGQNVILLDSKGSKVGSATTDADGWEFMTVSAPGKSASYTAFWDQDKDGVKDATEPYQNITWGGPTKFVEVNFDYIVGSNPTIDALL